MIAKKVMSLDPCLDCESDVKLVTRKRDKNGNNMLTLRCTNSKCQKYRSIWRVNFRSQKFLQMN
ncbi:hypothetical protein BpHYR1_016034 [Brachionus plicatilis]|uniref:Uncharacterized protein n=1 Tax=Brachionus plicatilis TaxID=10195 RepID=A0A3M7SSL3_BRAPC|nr:hypothetical protein BpHYR1_016034 [Brachionus plicatilis]